MRWRIGLLHSLGLALLSSRLLSGDAGDARRATGTASLAHTTLCFLLSLSQIEVWFPAFSHDVIVDWVGIFTTLNLSLAR